MTGSLHFVSSAVNMGMLKMSVGKRKLHKSHVRMRNRQLKNLKRGINNNKKEQVVNRE